MKISDNQALMLMKVFNHNKDFFRQCFLTIEKERKKWKNKRGETNMVTRENI